MIIKFLKDVEVPQTRPWFSKQHMLPVWFDEEEEADPNKIGEELDLSKLTYRVDYDIISYP